MGNYYFLPDACFFNKLHKANCQKNMKDAFVIPNHLICNFLNT